MVELLIPYNRNGVIIEKGTIVGFPGPEEERLVAAKSARKFGEPPVTEEPPAGDPPEGDPPEGDPAIGRVKK